MFFFVFIKGSFFQLLCYQISLFLHLLCYLPLTIILYQIFSNLSIPFLCFFMFLSRGDFSLVSERSQTAILWTLALGMSLSPWQLYCITFLWYCQEEFRRILKVFWLRFTRSHYPFNKGNLPPSPLDNISITNKYGKVNPFLCFYIETIALNF